MWRMRSIAVPLVLSARSKTETRALGSKVLALWGSRPSAARLITGVVKKETSIDE